MPNEINVPQRGYFKRNDKSLEMIKIQTALKSQGFWDDVPFNENFGPASEASIKKFQAAKGLKADGLIGKETLKLLGFVPSATSAPTPSPASKTAAPSPASSSGGALLEFDHATKQFKKVNVSATYDQKYRPLIDPNKMPAPELTKAKLIDWKLSAEGGLSKNTSDTASDKPCPTPYKGVYGYHTNKGVTYPVWVNSFGTNNDARFLEMSHADWSTIFEKKYWDKHIKANYPESVNCLVVSFAWGGSKDATVTGAQAILGKTISEVSEKEAVAALLSARGQLFINISQPGKKNNDNRRGWIDNALNKLVKRMYGI